MTRPIKKKQKGTPNTWAEVTSRVIAALGDARWDYRTAQGVSTQTGFPKETVIKVLSSDSRVRESLIPRSPKGKLYTLKSRKSTLGDIWSTFREMSREKYSDVKEEDER
jgi:hypothetical protein